MGRDLTVNLSVWSPLRVEQDAGESWVRWFDTLGAAFDEPFWQDTARHRMRSDAVALLQPRTRLSSLPELVAHHQALPLAGLVLHWSRSGSTALVRAAGALPDVLALSEPAPLDEVLRTTESSSHPELVRAMVAALTQARNPRHRYAVVKLDSWSTLQLPLLRQALPDVPWVFVWRDPVEVLASHLTRGPGAHMVPNLLNPAMFGMSREEAVMLPREVYGARVLRALALAALSARDARSTFIRHADLTARTPDLLADWGLLVDATTTAEALGRDAKEPSRFWVDDAAQKQALAPAAVHAACEEHLSDVVEALTHA